LSDGGTATDGGSNSVDGGAAGADCDELARQYAAALASAKVCSLTALIEPCAEKRPSLIGCGCPTFINAGSGAQLDVLEATFTAKGCIAMFCPRCVAIDAGQCTPTGMGDPNFGECQDVR
jgi:hypothetical protein